MARLARRCPPFCRDPTQLADQCGSLQKRIQPAHSQSVTGAIAVKLPGLRIGLIGLFPPPSGGMANQTLQLAKLLRQEDIMVELVQVNRPYHPRWVAKLKGIRAAFRLLPYLAHLWRSVGKVQLLHIMANSGWSWHLFAAPAIWVGWIRGEPVIVNYHGGEAEAVFD